jgi:hypothetical protein
MHFGTWEIVPPIQKWDRHGQLGTGKSISVPGLSEPEKATVEKLIFSRDNENAEFRERLNEARYLSTYEEKKPPCTVEFSGDDKRPIIYDNCFIEYGWIPGEPATIFLGERRV